MKWKEYECNYVNMAKLQDKSDEYCIEKLKYAKRLFEKNVPIIYCQEHLCKLVGYSEEYLYSISNDATKFYRCFFIKKKNGKERKICEPLPSLKEIQYWILKEILQNMKISSYAKAYITGKSIKDNAKFHRKQHKVLSMDLKDFFPSITFKRVLNVFRKIGYEESVAVMLSNICCLDNCLPQGAPTSPALSNIIASNMDNKVVEYIGEEKIRYTRYADDLTFSGNFNEGDLIKNIERIVTRQGFLVNQKKTRIRKRNQRQEVTGVVVNQKMQVCRELRRRIRSSAYYISKYGYESHVLFTQQNRNNYLYYLIGISSYALFVNPLDEKMKSYLNTFKDELKHQNEIIRESSGIRNIE